MSALTEALERIMSWLERYDPDFVESFSSGLSRTEIDDTLHEFELIIPEELYELYKWRNGRTQTPYKIIEPSLSIYTLLPLHDAIRFARRINTLDKSFFYSGDDFLLPFLGYEQPELCLLELSNSAVKQSSVLILFEGAKAQLLAPNITQLFSFFAEAYEEGAYYLTVDEDGDKYVTEDEEKVEAIMIKYGLSVSALTA